MQACLKLLPIYFNVMS